MTSKFFYKYCIVISMVFICLSGAAHAKNVSVNYQNYAQAETSLTIQRILKASGGVNAWIHLREPTPIDKQSIIRMNRDTLYSIAVVDVSDGASVTVPETEKRYISMAVLNEYGYTNIFEIGGGKYTLNADTVGSQYALIIMRIFLNANDAEDIKKVNALQDKYTIQAKSKDSYTAPAWNMNEYDTVYKSLLDLFTIAPNANMMFGEKSEVNPVYFLVGTAGGFGGLSSEHAMYFNFLPSDEKAYYKATFKKMPVKAFWSVTIYNKDGYLFTSKHGASSINSSTVKQSKDGTYTLYFGNCAKEKVNCLATEEGWNAILRMYEPDEEVINGRWIHPRLEAIQAKP